MASDNRPPLLGLFGIGGDNRIPASVDLEEDLNLPWLVDRLQVGGLLGCGLLVSLGLVTALPATVQVGVALGVVLLLDLIDRRVGPWLLERGRAAWTDSSSAGSAADGEDA